MREETLTNPSPIRTCVHFSPLFVVKQHVTTKRSCLEWVVLPSQWRTDRRTSLKGSFQQKRTATVRTGTPNKNTEVQQKPHRKHVKNDINKRIQYMSLTNAYAHAQRGLPPPHINFS